nr:unnamed protein product [Callosobruchus analis]
MSDYRGIAPMCFSGNIAENWKAWRQRFENYLIASEVSKKDQKIQIAQLLHYIGEEGMTIFNTFAFEADEERHKLKIVLEKFDKYFLPKRNISYERFKFFTRKQMPTESIEQFVTDLKNKARSCEFGELKDSLIKDMLTCGLANTKLREQLLQDDEKTLEVAIKFCLAVEKSKEQSVSMGMSNDVTVNQIHRSQHQKTSKNAVTYGENWKDLPSTSGGWRGPSRHVRSRNQLPENGGVCYKCGKIHGKNKCPAFRKKCNKCGKFNHFSKVCRQKSVATVSATEPSEEDEQSNSVFIYSVNQKQLAPNCNSWFVNLLVNNKPLIAFSVHNSHQTSNLAYDYTQICPAMIVHFSSDLFNFLHTSTDSTT